MSSRRLRGRRPLVFFGDSVTAAGRNPLVEGDLGTGYVRVIAETLGSTTGAPEVVNLGIGGNRVRDLRARWNEVESAQPGVLSVLIGINDVWRHFDQGEHTSPEAFREDLSFIMEAAVAIGAPVILLEPFLLPLFPEQLHWLPELREKLSIVNDLGATYGAPVIHLHKLLNTAAKKVQASDLATDGIHPSELGHRIIAQAWLLLPTSFAPAKTLSPAEAARGPRVPAP
ncbi:SGNH/GDSL hydrolase family protein [Leifsonia sp. 2MCAF36]|uniref:SGNH/GDSL hydrolase family protein n=1 Tax=Leifsonia sp. 2MCAF36 TaxID=3232988 RepID=UPI003F9E505B